MKRTLLAALLMGLLAVLAMSMTPNEAQADHNLCHRCGYPPQFCPNPCAPEYILCPFTCLCQTEEECYPS
jgi:hypothetical protein